MSPIKHTDYGSNDDVFWQIFDELENQSPDKKTVNGYKLKARLVSTNKFFLLVTQDLQLNVWNELQR